MLRNRLRQFLIQLLPFVCFASLSFTSALAQNAALDGRALMQSAAELNGLVGEGIHPWHLKVSYSLTDDTGKTTGQGTLDELWAGSNRYKVVITGSGFEQTEYGTDAGTLRSTPPRPLPEPVARLVRTLTAPLPSLDAIRYEDFLVEQKSLGATKLDCVAARTDTEKHKVVNTGLVYCFDAEKPILRISDNSSDQTRAIYNVLVTFQGRYVARDLRLIRNGKPELTARLDALEPLNSINPADFTPPADGGFAPHAISISPDIAEGLLLHKTRPPYPANTAGQSGTIGTVNVEVTIDSTGHVKDGKAVTGPLILHQPAVDAVRQWLYRPFLLNGQPVDVHTTISVQFDPFQ